MSRTARVGMVLVAAALAACDDSDPNAIGGASGDPAIHPAALFSGYDDGSAEYKVPATLANFDSKNTVTWSVADESLATVEIQQPPAGEKPSASFSHHVTVTTKKAGKTTLRGTANGRTFEVPLTITQYAPGARDLGNDLYQEDRSGGAVGASKALGCIKCHGGPGAAGHSPSQIGGYDDAAILHTIATGEKPDGGLANGGAHKFVLEPAEQQGILARLRSLEPTSWPE